MEFEADYSCPYCGETISAMIDPSAGTEQDYVEDCQVCCKPVRLLVTIEDEQAGIARIDASPENE